MAKFINQLKSMAVGLIFAFLVNMIGPVQFTQAQDFALPAPGLMVPLSPVFDPSILKGIKVHPDNPFQFDFILDRGDGQLANSQLKDESTKLIKYFLASLTTPEKDLWVNLSPYEKNRIVPECFGQTQMGRDLLAEDYMLKQITASLIYPEGQTGKKFWKRIYEESARRFGTTDIPVNTFNKVWIVPDKAIVYENVKAGTAYVVEAKLKVMLEQDYLSFEKHGIIARSETTKRSFDNINFLGSQIAREIVIPELTKEVNEDKNFSQLRQVYNSLILATWYKKKIKDSTLAQVYENKNKVVGVNIDDPKEKQRIYERYVQAFKKGVFNYIKDTGMSSDVSGPRKYFSGGMDETHLDLTMTITSSPGSLPDTAMVVSVNVKPSFFKDAAMMTVDQFFKLSPDDRKAEIKSMGNYAIEDLISDWGVKLRNERDETIKKRIVLAQDLLRRDIFTQRISYLNKYVTPELIKILNSRQNINEALEISSANLNVLQEWVGDIQRMRKLIDPSSSSAGALLTAVDWVVDAIKVEIQRQKNAPDNERLGAIRMMVGEVMDESGGRFDDKKFKAYVQKAFSFGAKLITKWQPPQVGSKNRYLISLEQLEESAYLIRKGNIGTPLKGMPDYEYKRIMRIVLDILVEVLVDQRFRIESEYRRSGDTNEMLKKRAKEAIEDRILKDAAMSAGGQGAKDVTQVWDMERLLGWFNVNEIRKSVWQALTEDKRAEIIGVLNGVSNRSGKQKLLQAFGIPTKMAYDLSRYEIPMVSSSVEKKIEIPQSIGLEVRPGRYVLNDGIVRILEFVFFENKTIQEMRGKVGATGPNAVIDLAGILVKEVLPKYSPKLFPFHISGHGDMLAQVLFFNAILNVVHDRQQAADLVKYLLKDGNIVFSESMIKKYSWGHLKLIWAHEEHHRLWHVSKIKNSAEIIQLEGLFKAVLALGRKSLLNDEQRAYFSRIIREKVGNVPYLHTLTDCLMASLEGTPYKDHLSADEFWIQITEPKNPYSSTPFQFLFPYFEGAVNGSGNALLIKNLREGQGVLRRQYIIAARKADEDIKAIQESKRFVKSGDDVAMVVKNNTGGIDLSSDEAMIVKSDGSRLQFHIDPKQLKELENAPGFVPVIISIHLITDLKSFLTI